MPVTITPQNLSTLSQASHVSILVPALLEGMNIIFMKNIQWGAWLISAAITAAFAVVINMIALRKVKHLKLSDMTE